MRYILPIFICALFSTSVMFWSCGTKHQQDASKPLISVSVLPQKYFVEKIAGDLFDIHVMIPSTGSCETYEPEPVQIEGLQRSKAYLTVGHIHFEETWIDKFKSTNPDLHIVNISEGIEIHEEDACHEEPHLWTSVKSARIMAANILKELTMIDPGNKDRFTENYDRFILELDSLDSTIAGLLSPLKNRSFMIYHPALGQFAADYGFKQLAVEDHGKSPSPRALEELIDKAKTGNIRLIFYQEQFEKDQAAWIAKETGAEMIPVNPMDYDWKKQILLIATSLNTYCR